MLTQECRETTREADYVMMMYSPGVHPVSHTMNKKKSSARPKKSKRQPKLQLTPLRPTLSECASNYLSVLENPFSGKSFCIPTEYTYPSMKESFRARGTLQTGTVGNTGAICVNPFAFFFSDTNATGGASPTAAILYTSSASTSANFPVYTDVGAVAASSNSNLSVTNTFTQLAYRLVGCGLRVRNVTPYLSRGGSIYGGEMQQHSDLSGISITTFMNNDTSAPGDPNGAWSSVVHHPIMSHEFQVFDSSFIGTNAAPATGFGRCRYLGFIASAPTGTPQTYEWEVYGSYELSGVIVHGLTRSLSDPVGMAAVQNSHSTISDRKLVVGDRSRIVQDKLYTASMNLGATLLAGGMNYISNRLSQPRPPPIGRRPLPMIEEVD